MSRHPRAAGLALALLLTATACTQGEPIKGRPAAVAKGAAQAEPTAGGWRTWVLTAPDQVPVPPPPAAGSERERAEDTELSQLARRRTPEITDIVRHWNADGEPLSGPWVEMALDFISARAKNPPASSRAYALLNVATYDATVATWAAKYRYDRPAPKTDSPLVAPGPDPSYPSEQAAVAGAASRVLAYLFPERPAARLDEAAEEAADSRVWAGANRRSDVDAGLALGRGVADLVIARAKADGSDALWNGKRPPGIGRGPRFWEPQPGSVANPVAPLAGSWKTWVMTSGHQFRPGPPPPYGSADFLAQAMDVVEVKKRLTPAQKRTATYWAGGQGTPLPAGIWDRVVLAYLRDRRPSGPQAERVLALANVAMADAGVAAWDAKYTYWNPRPENAIQDLGLDPHWEPYLVDTPFFPSYVSGHATYSGAVSEVLAYLFPASARDFRAKAQEASNSRLWGGIHWRLDNEVGLGLGKEIGALVIASAASDGAPALH